MLTVRLSGKRAAQWYRSVCCRAVAAAERNSSTILFGVGALLLVGGLNELADAQVASVQAQAACSRLLAYMETGFGALVAAAAGVGAIVASAVGGFKAAWSLLVVSIGAFILRAYITLFNAGC
ncbi:MAG: hypothetical protein U0136_16580 [Bdellovibrionota bacterium]